MLQQLFRLIIPILLFNQSFAQQPKLILPTEHNGSITEIRISKNNKFLITSSEDGNIKVWMNGSGILLYNLKHNGPVKSFDISHDDKFILSGSNDSTLFLWDLASGTLFKTYKIDYPVINKVVLSNDNQIIYCSDENKHSYIFELKTGALLKKISGGQIQVSFKNKVLATITDSSILFLSTATFIPRHVIYFKSPTSLIINQQGDAIAVIGYDDSIFVFSLTSFNLINRLGLNKRKGTPYFSLNFNQQGTCIYAHENYGWKIHLWNLVKNKKYTYVFEIPADDYNLAILSTHMQNDDSVIWTLIENNLSNENKNKGMLSRFKIVKLNILSGNVLDSLTFQKNIRNISHIVFSPDYTKMVFANNNKIHFFSIAEKKEPIREKPLFNTFSIIKMQLTPDNRKIVALSNGNRINIIDEASGKIIFQFKGGDFSINKKGDLLLYINFNQAENKYVTSIVDLNSGKLINSLEQNNYYDKPTIPNNYFSENDSMIVFDYRDSFTDTTSVINAYTGKTEKHLIGAYMPGFRYSYISRVFKDSIYANWRDSTEIWDNEKHIMVFYGKIHAVAPNRNSTNILFKPLWETGNTNLYEVETSSGKITKELKGHKKFIEYFKYSDDEKSIISSSRDGTVKIWNAENNTLENSLFTDSSVIKDNFYIIKSTMVENVLFTPDNRKIITENSGVNEIRFWSKRDNSLLKVLRGRNINMTKDGKRLFYNDLSDIICLRLSDYSLIYKLTQTDSANYIVSDQKLRYDGTEATRKLLYFTCGTEIIELDQVKDQLWVPNLAERINNGETINAKTLNELNICGLTPEVEDASTGVMEYNFKITPRRGGLGETVLYVNGIEAKRYKPAQLRKTGGVYQLRLKKEELDKFFIAGRQNPVTVKAYTADNAISSRGLIVNEDKTKESTAPPNLYAVMVGVSDYKGDELDLRYAAKDATDISAAISNAAKKLLNTDGKEHVFMYNLTTAKEHYLLPEKNSIKKVLEEIGKKATANDILIIFFAGHGVMTGEEDKKQFYFLSADASSLSTTDAVKDVGISTTELVEWMKPQNIKAQKRILIFDACNSGQAINDIASKDMKVRNDDKAQQIKAIDKLNEKSGLFILSASASNQSAYEMGRYSQGLLTYSLLKAIKQQPDILNQGKYLDLSRWFDAAKESVSDLAKESGARQEPQIVTNTNFNIGVVDEEVMAKIVLPQEKPLFAATNFQNADENITDDNLELSKMINGQLNETSSRGTDSKIIYVTATNSPDAYLLIGRYDVKGEELTVKVNIKQGKEIKYRFEVKGRKDNIKELAEMVVQQATEWILKNK